VIPIKTLVVYGVGLLGGSLGLAAKQGRIAERVLGIGRNADRLKRAQALGAIDEFATEFDVIGPDCQMAVVCTPVGLVPKIVIELAGRLPQGAVITDVGSTKGKIVHEVAQRLPADGAVRFVGSHPMAGSEKTGVESARTDLYQGAACLVTPLDSTPPESLERVEAFWKALKARVIRLRPEEHDLLVATASHVPHLAAAALARLLGSEGGRRPAVYDVIGEGFRDSTRIAAGDPGMWRDICLNNREAIVQALDGFIRHLQEIRSAVAAEDAPAIEKQLAEGQAVRRRIDKDSGNAPS